MINVCVFVSSHCFEVCWVQVEKGDVMYFDATFRNEQHLNQNVRTVAGLFAFVSRPVN